MIESHSGRPGAARVFRVSTPAGSGFVLERDGRWFDLSHDLAPTKRGDLLELLQRGTFEGAPESSAPPRGRAASAPTRILSPLERRHVGKVLAVDGTLGELVEDDFDPADLSFTNRPPATLVGHGDWVEPHEPRGEGGVLHHELFLGVVIARRLHGADFEQALDSVAGFVTASDFTRRTLDGRPSAPWLGASPTGTLAIGPAFVPRRWLDLSDLTARAHLIRGDAPRAQIARSTGEFLVAVPRAVAAISRLSILHPGDLVLVPSGISLGALVEGDEARCAIDGAVGRSGIGELANAVGAPARIARRA